MAHNIWANLARYTVYNAVYKMWGGAGRLLVGCGEGVDCIQYGKGAAPGPAWARPSAGRRAHRNGSPPAPGPGPEIAPPAAGLAGDVGRFNPLAEFGWRAGARDWTAAGRAAGGRGPEIPPAAGPDQWAEDSLTAQWPAARPRPADRNRPGRGGAFHSYIISVVTSRPAAAKLRPVRGPGWYSPRPRAGPPGVG